MVAASANVELYLLHFSAHQYDICTHHRSHCSNTPLISNHCIQDHPHQSDCLEVPHPGAPPRSTQRCTGYECNCWGGWAVNDIKDDWERNNQLRILIVQRELVVEVSSLYTPIFRLDTERCIDLPDVRERTA